MQMLTLDQLKVESFAVQASEEELESVKGGTTPACYAGAAVVVAVVVAVGAWATSTYSTTTTTTVTPQPGGGSTTTTTTTNMSNGQNFFQNII